MDDNNLTVARISKDAEATFVKEGDLIPASSTEFTGITLEGRTLAMFIPIAEQLLSSAIRCYNDCLRQSYRSKSR